MTHSETDVVSRGRRMFTVEHADRSLVLVRRIVADVVSLYGQLLELQEQVEVLWESPGQQRRAACETLADQAERLRTCLEELDDVGAELRDWGLGVVDYPSLAGGREVRLTWRHGDPSVAHWHEIDEDAAIRRPLETLPVKDASPAEMFR